MSVLTEKVVSALTDVVPTSVLDFSCGDDRPRAHTRVLRNMRAARCIAALIAAGRVRNGRLYITGNSTRAGMLMTALMVFAGRRLGYRIFLHHHVYNYLVSNYRTMAWIDRQMVTGDVHVVHALQMMRDFQAQYASKSRFAFLHPSITSPPIGQLPRQRPDELCLGLLSNLSNAKGLDLVLESFRRLRERGRRVRLLLAGPFGNPEAERLVRAAVDEFQPAVQYIGAVYDRQKAEFFRSIDCFLFPTRSESWGIVLNESLAAGVPVIATNRGCIETLVGERAGLVVSEASQYVTEAVRQVEAWIDSPQAYYAASQAAIEQAETLHVEAQRQLASLVAMISGPAESERPQRIDLEQHAET